MSPTLVDDRPTTFLYLLLENLVAVGSPRLVLGVRPQEMRIQRLVVNDTVQPLWLERKSRIASLDRRNRFGGVPMVRCGR